MFSSKQHTEQELLQGCLQGDRRLMEAFYKRYFPALYPVASRYARDELETKEILNTSMLKAFQHLHTVQTDRPLFPWLKAIVVRTGLDLLRTQFRRQVSATLDAAAEVYAEEDTAEWLDAEAVERLLRQLPPLTRAVFNLYAIEGFNHQEVAVQLDITENNSRWHLHQARQQLKKYILHHESEKKFRPAVA